MDTYSIYKAAKHQFFKLLKESHPDKDDYWCDCEADVLADEVVQECIKCGSQYPFSEINKPYIPPSVSQLLR
jgi:hypothetical protein